MMFRQIQLAIMVGIFLSIGVEASSTKVLQEIWRLRQSILTCTNRLNYACRCDATKDETCSFKCIPLDRRCNGYVDCPLGDDETDCPDKPCHKGEVCCPDGGCAHTCDGKTECSNEADEELCEPPVPSECPGEMQCPSGRCATVCDRDVECDEEPEDCELQLDEQDCRHICTGSGDVVCGVNGECAEWCTGGVQCDNGYDESMCLIKCDEDEISCELENSFQKGCVELCDGAGKCESSEDELDIYCAECQFCGIEIEACTKIDNCPG